MTFPIRPDLRGLEPYGAPQLDVPVRLNVNENPYSPSPAVVEDIAQAVAKVAAGLNRYPDRDFLDLRVKLADYLRQESHVEVQPDHIWAANGSNEVMIHLLQAFGGPGRTAASFAPTYSMYHEYARDTQTIWVQGKRTEDFSLNLEYVCETLTNVHPSLLLLASPNNPTGTALDLADVETIVKAARHTGPALDRQFTDTIVVIDEAYAEFRRRGTPSALELSEKYPNLVVTRTMSKAFGMAGLRLGYMVAHPEVIDIIKLVRLPYHLSATTQAVAEAALRHGKELMSQVAQIRADRDELAEWLAGQGFEVAASDANFVMFGRFPDRQAVFQGLLDRGVLIRVVGPEGFLRVSVGTPQENEIFKSALLEVVA